jgi:Tfp pilus assembly protein PilP
MATKRGIVALLLCAFVGFGPGKVFPAEETVRTPSDQMKDAVNKFGKAPATIGKSLQDLTDAAKEKLRETFGAKPNTESKPAPVNLELPKKTPEATAAPVRLNGSNRDPFRSPLMPKKATVRVRENLSPLEQKDLSQLNLVGIVGGNKEPAAVIVDTAGLSYIVNVGTPIGLREGTIKSISSDEVVVEEYCEDVSGTRKKCIQRMILKTE